MTQNTHRHRLECVVMFVLIAMTGLALPTHAQRGRSPDREADFTIVEEVPGSQSPLHLAFVLTKDFIHTPIALRKPQGEGPFPIVLFLTGNGGGGMARARWAMQNMGYTMERFLEAGYAVAYLRYRGEVPLAYREVKKLNVRGNTLERSPLDHDDVLSAIAYVKRLEYIDADRVGMIGVSHGGELIMKAASETSIAAAVCSEPASHEYLALAMDKLPPGEPQLQNKARAEELSDKAEAMSRIRNIDTPLLIVGRDGDHLQGLFMLCHDMLQEAGKDVSWKSYTHPNHGFVMPRRGADGAYNPDEIQLKAIEDVMRFFEKRLK